MRAKKCTTTESDSFLPSFIMLIYLSVFFSLSLSLSLSISSSASSFMRVLGNTYPSPPPPLPATFQLYLSYPSSRHLVPPMGPSVRFPSALTAPHRTSHPPDPSVPSCPPFLYSIAQHAAHPTVIEPCSRLFVKVRTTFAVLYRVGISATGGD